LSLSSSFIDFFERLIVFFQTIEQNHCESVRNPLFLIKRLVNKNMAPKTKQQFEEIRQQSKAAIMQAALELFAQRGFDATSISQIAKEAGISKGLMYNYFSSKEELLKAIVSNALTDGKEMTEVLWDESLDPKEQLIRMIRGVVDQVKDNRQYWKLMTSLSLQKDVMSGMEEMIQKGKAGIIERITMLFGQLQVEDPLKEGYILGAFLDGIMLHYIVMEENYPLEEMADYFIREFIEKRYPSAKS
jgi:AcrR family transcriptional regulator